MGITPMWQVRILLAVGGAHFEVGAGVDGGKVEGGAAMTSSNPVYKRRRLDISPPQQQVGRDSHVTAALINELVRSSAPCSRQ